MSNACRHTANNARTLREAWREMFDTWEKQKSDPSYQFDTPVPSHDEHTDGGELGASLGDLTPDSLREDRSD